MRFEKERKAEEKTHLRLVEPSIAEIRNLTKDFDSVRALDNVSVEIPEGHIFGLLGANGSYELVQHIAKKN